MPTSVILVSIFASVTFHEPRPAMPAKTIPKPAGAPSREDHRQQKKRERHARENRCAAGGFRPLPAVRVRPIPRTNVTLAERSMLITSGFRACDSSQFGVCVFVCVCARSMLYWGSTAVAAVIAVIVYSIAPGPVPST